MSTPTAAQFIKQVPQDRLDSQVSDVHIEELISKITVWQDFSAYFGLSEAEEEEIRRNNEKDYRAQKRAALRLWREKKGREATYRQLIIVFFCLQKIELADSVKQLLQAQKQESPVDILDTFRSYLVDCYAQSAQPSQISWPISRARTAVYVDLPLFEVPLTEQEPGGQKELPPQKLVELDTIFAGSHKTKKKVVLLEGVAGSGKTTLTWHACQQWAEGSILQQFRLLIHVSLADPAVRSATCLADIIPHPSSAMREAVATAIAEKHGKKVCFLLDGWDEAHPDLQKFIHTFVAGSSGRSMLPRCSIVVTSRPVAAGLLHPLLTSRVVVGKLDRANLNDLLSACITPEESKELLKILEQNSQLGSLWNLPINAAIIIHLFQCGHRSLPETRTGLFKALVCNLLIRHVQLRTRHGLLEIEEFEDLPQDTLKELKAVCSLAFKGKMSNNSIFDTRALRRAGLTTSFDTLGLMEVQQQLTCFGPSRRYSFLHYSVQEFLAAWHMSRLGSEEQTKAVSDVLHSNPLSFVLPFFAGLTGLSSPAVRDILLKVAKNPLDPVSVFAVQPLTESNDRRRLALALFNCIFESQDDTICQHVNPPLPPGLEGIPGGKCCISFSQLGLRPSDCLSLSYFMAHRDNFAIDLCNCFIGEAGVAALLNHLEQPASACVVSTSSTFRYVILSGNLITTHSMKLISSVLETNLLTSICFTHCWNPARAAPNLTYLIKGLCRRMSPFCIDLSGTVTGLHAHYLVLLLTTCPIYLFQLTYTNVSDEMPIIAEAMKNSTSLEQVWMSACSIGDRELVCLGKALQTNGLLVVDRNPFSSSAVQEFLRCQFRSSLQQLDIGRRLNARERRIYDQLINSRYRNNRAMLFVVNKMAPENNRNVAHTQRMFSLPPSIRTRSKLN